MGNTKSQDPWTDDAQRQADARALAAVIEREQDGEIDIEALERIHKLLIGEVVVWEIHEDFFQDAWAVDQPVEWDIVTPQERESLARIACALRFPLPLFEKNLRLLYGYESSLRRPEDS